MKILTIIFEPQKVLQKMQIPATTIDANSSEYYIAWRRKILFTNILLSEIWQGWLLCLAVCVFNGGIRYKIDGSQKDLMTYIMNNISAIINSVMADGH